MLVRSTPVASPSIPRTLDHIVAASKKRKLPLETKEDSDSTPDELETALASLVKEDNSVAAEEEKEDAKAHKGGVWRRTMPSKEAIRAAKFIDQKGPRFKEARQIGSTHAVRVCGYDGVIAAGSQWDLDTGRVTQETASGDTFCQSMGHVHEDTLARIYCLLLDCQVYETGVHQHPTIPYLTGSPDRLPGLECKVQIHDQQAMAKTAHYPKPAPKHVVQCVYLMGITRMKKWDLITGWLANRLAPPKEDGKIGHVCIVRLFANPAMYDKIVQLLQDYGKRVFQDYDDTESSEKWKIANLRPANRIHLLNEYEVTFQPLASVKWFKGGKVEVIRYTEPPITKTMAELFKL